MERLHTLRRLRRRHNITAKISMQRLSYNLKTGKSGYVGGITRGKIKVYIHELNTKLGEETFKARIAFAQTENIPPLLGRTDIFDHFKVCYNNKQKETTFILP